MSLHGVRLVGGEDEPLAGRAHVRYVADRLIWGAAARSEEDVRLSFVRVSFRGLREWLMGWTRDTGSPLPLVQPEPSADDDSVASARQDEWVRSLALEIEGVHVQAIVNRGPSRQSRFRTLYETSAWLQLESPEALTLAEWRRLWIEPLRDLVLFGTREQTVVLSLTGFPEAGDSSGEVAVFAAPDVLVHPPQHAEYHQRDLLPAGIWDEEGFEDLVAEWRVLHARLGAVAQAFFELLNTVDVAPLTRLLRLTACAEGYHRSLHDEPPFSDEEHRAMVADMVAALPEVPVIRDHYKSRLRHANSQSQRQRIRWLVERAATVDDRLAGKGAELTNRLVGWRNDHTHLAEDVTAPPLDDLLLLNAVLTYVLEANVLLDMGIDENTRYCLAHGHVYDDPIPAFLAQSKPSRRSVS